MEWTLICLCAVLLDRLPGQPRRRHPLAGFRRLAQRLEMLCYGPAQRTAAGRRLSGALALGVLIVPPALLAWQLAGIPDWGVMAQIGLLYLALAKSALEQEGRVVLEALQDKDLEQARRRLSRLVSRDTQAMDEEEISLTAVETILKKSCPALFGVLFWFLAAGAPGAVVYRLVMVLDELWGHATPRYRQFGWATARLYALLDWLPARLAALGYSLAGDRETAWRCWRRQARAWREFNSGPLLAAGAGALNLQLGGVTRYYGREVWRPALGEGLLPCRRDIARALRLVNRSLGLWLVLALLGEGLLS